MRSLCLVLIGLALLAPVLAQAQVAAPIVAVFRIEDKSGSLDPKAIDQLTTYLEMELARGDVYRIVPQAAIKAALVEKKQESYRECFDLKCQIELGRELAAEKSLATMILQFESGCTVSTALYDLKTQVTDAAEQEEVGCKVVELKKGIDRVVSRLKARRGGGKGEGGLEEGRIGGGQDAWEVGSGKQVIIPFNSTPSGEGVVVMVDGKLICQKTPCKKAVPIGPHLVAMQSERYQTRSERLTLAKGTKVDWELKPNFGWLSVRSEPAGMDVLVNNDVVGKTPLDRHELAPGFYEVLVRSPCHKEAGERVKIELDEEKEVRVELVPRLAAIQVSAKDQEGNDLEAEVLVDGEKVGEAPDTFKVSICARGLELRYPDKASKQIELSLSEREVKQVALVLEPPPAPAPEPTPEPTPEPSGGGEQPAAPAAPLDRTIFLALKVLVDFDLSSAFRDNTSDWGLALFDTGIGMLAEFTFDVKVMDPLTLGINLGFVYGKAESDQQKSDEMGLFDLGARMGAVLKLADTVDMSIWMGVGASMLMSELTGDNFTDTGVVSFKFDPGYVGMNLRIGIDVAWYFLENLGLDFEIGYYMSISGESNQGQLFDFGPLINVGVGVIYAL